MHTLCSLSCIGIYLNKHYFCCIHWLSYYLYSVMYSVMIMQEKIKKCHSTNSKFDFISWNSNIDYDIYRIFNAFSLNLRPIKNPHRIPTGPWGFITVPIPIPYPYPWESPWESPYPRQPCLVDGTLDLRLLGVSDSTIRIYVTNGGGGGGLEGLAPSPSMWAADALFLCGSWDSCQLFSLTFCLALWGRVSFWTYRAYVMHVALCYIVIVIKSRSFWHHSTATAEEIPWSHCGIVKWWRMRGDGSGK